MREIFTRYVDINAVPRRSFFALLKHFAQDDMEREKLDEFLSEEGAVRCACSSSVLFRVLTHTRPP